MLISCIPDVGMEGERGLVAGRSQREKRRSYKDLLREEEEIAAQVRKSSKKRPKVSCLSTIACPHGLISESHGVIAHFNILNLCVWIGKGFRTFHAWRGLAQKEEET